MFRFRTLPVAALIALLPGAAAAQVWPPLGTIVFCVVGLTTWILLDRR